MIRPLGPKVTRAARRLRKKKMAIEAIAAELKISKSAVHRAVADMGIDRRDAANARRVWPAPPWLGEAKRLLKAGVSRFEAAKRLGAPPSSFYRIMARFEK